MLVLTSIFALSGCSEPAPKVDPENAYRMEAFTAIYNRINNRDFSIVEVIPFDEKISLVITKFTDTEGNENKRLYKMDNKSTGIEIAGEYEWAKNDLMAISVNTAAFSGGTVIYGDINNDHMSSVDKMLMPVDLDSIHIKLENDPNLFKANLYDGFYMAIIKRAVVLEEVLFVNKKTSENDMPYNYAYGTEYDYIDSLTPKPDVEEGEPLYSKFLKDSDDWYIAKYIDPLVFTGALITESWTKAETIPYDVYGRLFIALADSNANFDYESFYDETLDRYMVPENVFEDIIKQHFDVPVKHLRRADIYKDVQGVYALTKHYSGTSLMRVEEIKKLNANTFMMTVNAYNSEPYSDENIACQYTLTIEQGDEPSSYKYLAYTYKVAPKEIS